MSKNSLIRILVVMGNIILVGCSTYPSKFKCGDARGLGCTMLSEVDKQINNGQIEEIYIQDRTKCPGNVCGKENHIAMEIPEVKAAGISRIYIERDNGSLEEYRDGDYLYVKN